MEYDGKYKYQIIFVDEYNNFWLLGFYDDLSEAKDDINNTIKDYLLDGDSYDNDDILSMECRFGEDTVLGEFSEYASTFSTCIDREIYVENGVIQIRGFVFK